MKGNDQQLLQIVQRLGDNAYGVTIYDALACDGRARRDRGPGLGTLFSTLERLECAGLLMSHTAEASGRIRLFWTVTERGRALAAVGEGRS